MITIPDLIKIKPDSVFAQGENIIPELHPTPVKWVAIRGGIHDWCIRYHFKDRTYRQVKLMGDKIKTHSIIKRLVHCSDDAFNMYRF